MRRSLALVLPFFIVAACSDDPVSPDTSHVGVYQMQSVNGAELPFTFEEDGETITVSQGSFDLNANMTFSVEMEMSFTQGEETTAETITVAGTYTRSGNTITLNSGATDEGFETATISADVLTTTGGGDEVLVFVRQD